MQNTIRKNLALFFNNFQRRIIVAMVSLVFIAVLISVYISFNQTQKFTERETSNLILSNMEQMGNQIENICLDMLKLSNILCKDNTVLINLDSEGEAGAFSGVKDIYDLTAKDILRMNAINNQINYAKSNFFFNYNVDMITISSDGLMMANADSLSGQGQNVITKEFGNEILKETRLEPILNNRQYYSWTVPYVYPVGKKDDKEKFISFATQVKSSYSSRLIGIIIVNVSLDSTEFKKIFHGNANGYMVLLDKEGKVIQEIGNEKKIWHTYTKEDMEAQTGQKGTYITNSFGEKKLVNYYELNRFGWKLISVIPYDYLMKHTISLRNKIYVINTITFGISITLCVLFILYLTNPLKKLINDVKRKKIGVYSLDDNSDSSTDDIVGIVNSFNHLFKRVDELVERVIDDQKIENDLRYETLKAQINPHFLFNTLNIIKWSAMMSGSVNVANMISDLGSLLEVSMNKGTDEISIKEEIELVKAYINIQNSRYDDRYCLEVKIDPELYPYKIIKLLLQPMIENAIIHGFINKKDQCKIEVLGKMVSGSINISIVNNGDMIPEDKIKSILNGSESATSSRQKFSGIGLSNIHERLKYKYGPAYGIKSILSENELTVILIEFPAHKDNEDVQKTYLLEG